MSKKNKKKFKSRLHQQVFTSPQVTEPSLANQSTLSAPTAKLKDRGEEDFGQSFEKNAKRELKLIGFTFLGIIILFVVAIILNDKTSTFSNLADWLYRILNIQ